MSEEKNSSSQNENPSNSPNSSSQTPPSDGGYKTTEHGQGEKGEDNGAGQAVDYQAEADKWKALSRKNESDLDKARRELDQLKASQMTESEKALADAKEEGRNAALSEYGSRLAEAEIKTTAASQGRKVPDGLSNFLNLSAFVGEDGNPDADAVNAFISTLPEDAPRNPYSQNTGIGPQGGTGTPQLSRADMSRMSPQEIVKAREEGRFDELLNGNTS